MAPTHGTFPRFLEMEKTAGLYSLQIYDYLSQIQRETMVFLLIVMHNTEGPPIGNIWLVYTDVIAGSFSSLDHRIESTYVKIVKLHLYTSFLHVNTSHPRVLDCIGGWTDRTRK